ncbi:MAG: tRNA lysidine(34) synthetase TilS [Bacteroidota bacterium]
MREIYAEKVAAFVSKHPLPKPPEVILVGISGGADSVLLAHVLRKLGYQIALAHVNYGLRGAESEAETQLVSRYAQTWEVPLYIHRPSPEALEATTLSFQEVARKIRYDWFEEVMAQEKIACCALAHHADDQIESILMNFMEGHHPSLLKGIPPVRGPYVRPLLRLRKAEILAAVEAEGLEYGMDSSNQELSYRRNQYRHQLLPHLEAWQGGFQERLLKRYQLHSQGQDWLTEQCRAVWQQLYRADEQGWEVHLANMPPHAPPLELVLAYGLELHHIHGYALWAALDLAKGPAGKKLEVAQGVLYRTSRGLQMISSSPFGLAEPMTLLRQYPQEAVEISLPGERIRLLPWEGPMDFQSGYHFLDAGRISFPLHLRPLATGDRMLPLGMNGQQKLSDIMVNRKFSPRQKQQAWVLVDQDRILLLKGFRISEHVKISDHTQQILAIEVTKVSAP